MYDFRKIRNKDKLKEYKHIFFRKDKAHLLEYIKRKNPDQAEAAHDQLKESLHMVDEWQKVTKIVNGCFDNTKLGNMTGVNPIANEPLFKLEINKLHPKQQTSELITCFMLYVRSQKENDPIISQEKSE